MQRKAILWSLVCVALPGALWGAGQLRQRQDAARLRLEATHLMSLPLERAATLSDLPAARAVMLLDDALRLDDGADTRELRQLAYALSQLQKDRPERAREALARAGRARDSDLGALIEAELAFEAGDHDDARQRLVARFGAAATHPRARVLQADVALALGEAASARAMLDHLAEEHPEVGALFNRRGIAREASGDRAGAREDFRRAAGLDASDPDPRLNLGRLLRQQGDHVAAEQAFDQALRLSAALPGAWLGRGLSRLAQGDLDGARLDLEQARTLAPAEPGPLLALGDLQVAAGAPAEAVPLYRAAVALDDAAVAWLKLGNALIRTGTLEQARQALEQAIALDPTLAAAHNGLGAALGALGDAAGAESALQRAAALDRADPNPLLNLARLREKRGDRQGAALALAEARERAPDRGLGAAIAPE